ncbi:pumilio [Salix suchowensis]|nr:pumilio [Salix suchowensis]
MEKSSGLSDNIAPESSDAMPSSAAVSSPVENLLLSAENLSLTEGSADGLSTRNFLDENGGSLQRIKENRINGLSQCQFENSMPVPTALSESVSGSNSLSNGGSFQGSRLHLGQKSQEQLKKVRIFLGLLRGDTFVNHCSNQNGLRTIQGLLRLRNPEITSEICNKVLALSSRGTAVVLELMLDQHGRHVFGELIDSLNYQQLKSIIHEITKNLDEFVSLTLTTPEMPLVSLVTNNLCAAFLTIMTNRTGSYVISECFKQLSAEDNKLLYEAAIESCLDLAIDHEGSLSLIRVFNTIQGPGRELCVQKLISLNNPLLTQKICHHLRGYYATISLQKGGSHIAEQCLDTEWKSWVVEDFLSSLDTPLNAAKDEFGNYVIQKALKVTKKSGSPLYHKLLLCLQPHLSILESGYGRNVFNLITGDTHALPVGYVAEVIFENIFRLEMH